MATEDKCDKCSNWFPEHEVVYKYSAEHGSHIKLCLGCTKEYEIKQEIKHQLKLKLITGILNIKESSSSKKIDDIKQILNK